MMPSTIISSALLAFIYLAAAVEECPENQVLAKCQGCPKTCGYLYSSTVCNTFACIPGCICKDGYVLNKDRVCIPQETCPEDEIHCDNHSTFSECGIQRTCEEPQGSNGKCKRGCFCVDGFLYNNRDQYCIDPVLCENSAENANCRKKDPNMEYKFCENDCFRSCPGHVDFNHCKECEKGCFCKRGLALDTITGECVNFENCTALNTHRVQ